MKGVNVSGEPKHLLTDAEEVYQPTLDTFFTGKENTHYAQNFNLLLETFRKVVKSTFSSEKPDCVDVEMHLVYFHDEETQSSLCNEMKISVMNNQILDHISDDFVGLFVNLPGFVLSKETEPKNLSFYTNYQA